MRVLLILGSASSSSSIAGRCSRRPSHSKALNSSLSNVFPTGTHSPLSSRPSTIHSRSPLLSSVQWDIAGASSGGKTSLRHYADVASKLAECGKLDDFAMVVESVVVAGVEPSQFAAVLAVELVAKGISRCLREGNLWNVVQVLRKVEELGISAVGLCDESAVESLRRECRRISKSGDLEELVEFMEVLSGFGFSIKEMMKPSEVIKLCVDSRNPKMAIRYASILPQADILFCTVINEFGKKRDLKSAFMAYTESKAHMNGPNMYIYRSIIDVCGLCGDYKKSRNVYHQDLLSQNVTPNVYVFNSLMNVNAHDLNYIFQLYKNMQNLGVPADMASYNILLKACCLAGRVDLAQDIYREVKHLETTGVLKLDVFTYSTIVKVFADAKLWKMALRVKEDMQSAGVLPNMVTWSSLISSCANSGLVELAIELFEEMVSAGCEPNTQCCNILLHACVEARQFDRAFRLFRSWKEKELWDDIERKNSTDDNLNADPTSQLCITNMPNAQSHVHQIKFAGNFTFKPTITTYNILMKACGTDYYHAKALMEEMKSVGLTPNHISWSILIDICGGSRDVKSAVQILTTMRMAGVDPDVVAYTTAIKVCVGCKNWRLAFSLFEEMKRFEIQPNLVTYSTLLRARSTYGSLHEVQQCLAIYQDMRKSGFKSDDHYLKELIAEWCEGVIQNNNQQQEEATAPCNRTDIGKPRCLILEKVAEHLQKSFIESLAIDLQDLTKVEARIVVLAVLRMIKENYALGESVKDDIVIVLGVSKVEPDLVQQNFEVRDAITKLLQYELGLEVLTAGPTTVLDEVAGSESSNMSLTKLNGIMGRNKYTTRKPAAVQRLKVTKKSLKDWLQRNRGIIEYR
ncbi:pentatricopeptide repeat-containing protein At5g02830, chloroplastic isoform X1 [Cucurbita maxima]|uniref:Pentatricopeptide repeat-containing protein At5g02830, chloroplastic isoform X1 n=1 Tax=Cucurbita maxima TaxID=3661 RepID=A0A6J1I6K5_CUCMA|nr:pentatricopeptide repeat-containing protein At5g02830, chloroplastic isoform X1 [Cucurbita maxima]